ncbi:hypothetical protein CRG98_020386 [Punica granatum]|uniref:Uncharacterized protein n=1 Tax=Punica granatum TaxID=22663 RepID=A0A2I0JTM6_PUNGR|nr:hypothetical protein CRG98_020386 [Punica granatum]
MQNSNRFLKALSKNSGRNWWSISPTQQREKREARDPSRLERFEYQHQHGDGSLINEEAAQLLDRAKKKVEDRVSASKTDGLIVDQVTVKNEVFTEGFGPEKHGRIRGYRYGMTISKFHAGPRLLWVGPRNAETTAIWVSPFLLAPTYVTRRQSLVIGPTPPLDGPRAARDYSNKGQPNPNICRPMLGVA